MANVYDNLISGNEDGTVLTPEEAITAIINRRAGAWNRHVVKALVRVVQCYPVGAVVRVKNNRSKRYVGYTGIVAKENATEQSKPTLVLTHDADGQEIPPEVVDFKDEKDMQLEIDS
ncbi:hypothetical protein BMS3Bbin04_00331 [bacterium BMS3Bbin04]|nr:hypothetical protein BMS3Bbin04_00331 [bacterium BMS3Bbin04]